MNSKPYCLWFIRIERVNKCFGGPRFSEFIHQASSSKRYERNFTFTWCTSSVVDKSGLSQRWKPRKVKQPSVLPTAEPIVFVSETQAIHVVLLRRSERKILESHNEHQHLIWWLFCPPRVALLSKVSNNSGLILMLCLGNRNRRYLYQIWPFCTVLSLF